MREITNTTDFATGARRALLRRVVREVEGVLAKDHPLRNESPGLPKWTATNVHNRATLILEHCDVWIRQRRPEAAQARRKAALLARAARVEALGFSPAQDLHDVDNVPLGPTHTTGRAWLHGRKLRLTLGDADAAKAAWLMRHEVWHLFGIGHEHFPRALMHEDGGALAAVRDIYGLAVGETLPLAAPSHKAAPDPEARAAAKQESLAARQNAWATKLKRAQTALAKIQKQTSYDERTLAVTASRKL